MQSTTHSPSMKYLPVSRPVISDLTFQALNPPQKDQELSTLSILTIPLESAPKYLHVTNSGMPSLQAYKYLLVLEHISQIEFLKILKIEETA